MATPQLDQRDVAAGRFLEPVLDPGRFKSLAVVSDLHLGADNCVLDDATLDRLAHQLVRFEIAANGLVLNGDLFDFALSTFDRTLERSRAFLQRFDAHFGQFVYVPGNHDHHSWLLANELHELLLPFPNVKQRYLARTERMYHSTFLQRLLVRPDDDGPPAGDILIAYPNLYWSPPGAPDHAYVFHHGHFCEDLYSLVWSVLSAAFPPEARKPDGPQWDTLEALESASFGWLEMIWYQFGQAGVGVGADGLIGGLYAQLDQHQGDPLAVLAEPLRNLYDRRIGPMLGRVLDEWARRTPDLTHPAIGLIRHGLETHGAQLLLSLISELGAKGAKQAPGASALRGASLDGELAARCRTYLEFTKKTRKALPPMEKLSMFFGHTHVAGAHPAAAPTLFNDGGWIRHPDGSWPDAHVLVLEADGSVWDLYFAETDAACTYTRIRAPL